MKLKIYKDTKEDATFVLRAKIIQLIRVPFNADEHQGIDTYFNNYEYCLFHKISATSIFKYH